MIEQLPDLLLEAIRITDFQMDPKAVEGAVGRDTLHFLYSTETRLEPSQDRVLVEAYAQYFSGETTLMQMEAVIPFVVPGLVRKYRIDHKTNEIVFRNNLIPTLLSITSGTVRGLVAAKVQTTSLADYPLPVYSSRLLVEANKVTLGD